MHPLFLAVLLLSSGTAAAEDVRSPAEVAAAALPAMLRDARHDVELRKATEVEKIASRFACVEVDGVRVESTTITADAAVVALTLDGHGDLPISGRTREIPAHWIVRLRRAGTWQIENVYVAETDLAAALAATTDVHERLALLSECGERVDGELARRVCDIAFRSAAQAKYARAGELGEMALAIARECGDRINEARALWMIGRSLDLRMDDDGALAHYNRARAIAEREGDAELLARLDVGEGFVRGGTEAIPLYDAGLALAARLHNDQIAEEGFLGRGNSHQNADEYVEALRDYDEARLHAARTGDLVIEAASVGNIGLVHNRMSNYQLASEYLHRAIELYRRANNVRGVIRNYANLADAQVEVTNLPAETADTLAAVRKLLAVSPNPRTEAFVTHTASKLAMKRHQWELAEEECRKAIALAEQTHSDDLITSAMLTLARIRAHRDDVPGAIEMLKKTIAGALTAPNFDAYWNAQTDLGRLLIEQGHVAEARAALEAAVAAIEGRRADVPGSGEDEQRFFIDKTGPYYELMRSYAKSGDAPMALFWAERARGRTLIESLARHKVKPSRWLTAAERAEESALEQRIIGVNVSLREARENGDANRVTKLQQELQQARLDRADLVSRLYQAHPELSIARGDIQPPAPEELRAAIPADGALAEYLVLEDMVWLIVATRDEAPRVYPIDVKVDALDASVSRFRAKIAKRQLDYRTEARALYDLLLRPAEVQLAAKRVIAIVPDGPLWTLPFQALLGSDGKFAIEEHALFYAPSASLLVWQSKRARDTAPPPEALFAVGNPKISNMTRRMAAAVRSDELLGDLPDAAIEAERIAELYPGATVLTGAAATEARVRRDAGKYRIVHLATHGILDNNDPMYSHVVLARAPSDVTHDGLLEAREIADLDLRADLVVLSSCDTGRGEVRPGEGMTGLSWALLAAGCPTSVLTQTKVPSASTRKLMVAFHRRLATAQPTPRRTSESLRAAERSMIADAHYRHPFHWAGFVVMGAGW